MTTTTKRAGVSLLEVQLSDGTRWRGTEAQLRRAHPDWLPYAQWVAALLSHRPAAATPAAPYGGHSASIHPEDAPPYKTDDQAADEDDEEENLAGYPDEQPRMAPASAVRQMQRYQGYPGTRVDVHAGPPPLVRRASRRQPNPKRPPPDDGTVYEMPPRDGWHPSSETPAAKPRSQRSRTRRRVHPLLTLGLGMLVMLALWQAGLQITTWWQVHQDDVTYGRPRTSQTDAVVGHFDSAAHPSHFEAENLHRRVVVFELPGGDASKTRVYVGPPLYGPDADLAPVTLTFPLIGGKVAMVVNVQGSHLVYLNKQVKGVWQFVPQQG